MINIIAHSNASSRIVEREIKDLNIPENELNVDIENKLYKKFIFII